MDKRLGSISRYTTGSHTHGLKDNCGVFVIKAFLNGDEMEFECLLRPQIQEKKQRVVNTNTPAKQLQFEYWQAYFEKCDELQSEMQINPAPRHYQYIVAFCIVACILPYP